MGSFNSPLVYLTDLPCEDGKLCEVSSMKSCESCLKCIRNCPTGCISENTFLVNAEKCLTFFNENEDKFPGWIKKSWHHTIVGCMRCQIACKENKEFLKDVNTIEFFKEAETELILKETPYQKLPSFTKNKLEELCMTDYYDVLARNLQVLINK